MNSIRVLIADDHAIVRDGVRALLALSEDITVVGEAANGQQAVELARAPGPDVILMDIAMPGLGGLEATHRDPQGQPGGEDPGPDAVRGPRVHPAVPQGGRVGVRAEEGGRVGADDGHPRRVTRRAGAGSGRGPRRRCASRSGRQRSGQAADPYDALTDREKQVLKLVAEGHSNKEVAELLDISVKTAMSHREHIMQKLDLHSRTDLIRFAIQQGVIRVDP